MLYNHIMSTVITDVKNTRRAIILKIINIQKFIIASAYCVFEILVSLLDLEIWPFSKLLFKYLQAATKVKFFNKCCSGDPRIFFYVSFSTIAQLTSRCTCKLVAVKGTTISEPNVSFPVAAFVGPMKANPPCHNPFVHFGMASI